MDLFRIKRWVCRHQAIYAAVDRLLNIYAEIRFWFTKSYTEGREDRISMELLENDFGMLCKDIVYPELFMVA